MGDVSELPRPRDSTGDDGRDRDHGRGPDERFRERLSEAAVEAEFRTGIREETVAEAKAAIHVRLARMTLGFLVVLVGIVMVPIPGPGWLIIATGLAILSRDLAWAERTLAIVRRRIPVSSDGRVHPKTWAAIGASTTLSVSASLWWTFWR